MRHTLGQKENRPAEHLSSSQSALASVVAPAHYTPDFQIHVVLYILD